MSRHALIVYAHPVAESYTSAIRDRVCAGLDASGCGFDVLDLYSEEFDPCITAAELAGEVRADRVIDDHLARMAAADTLVFVHPTWWGGQPAIVKGWLDRVLCRSSATPSLRRIRKLVVVSPHGSGRLRNAAQGVPGKRITFRLLRARCHPMARSSFIGFYGNDTASPSDRTDFLDRVEVKVRAITSGRRRLRLRQRS